MQTTFVAVAVLAGIALLLWKLKHRLVDEDRPEIVVRNGRLRINTGKDWRMLSSAKRWKPDHREGKSVVEYEVTVKNANEPRCDNTTLTGKDVKIVFETNSEEETVRLVRELENISGKYEPVIDSDIDLEHEPSNRRVLRVKLDPEAKIKKVKVSSHRECTFPKDATQPVVVKVNIKH